MWGLTTRPTSLSVSVHVCSMSGDTRNMSHNRRLIIAGRSLVIALAVLGFGFGLGHVVGHALL